MFVTTEASSNILIDLFACSSQWGDFTISSLHITTLDIPELIIPLAQSQHGAPQFKYIVQSLVDTPIFAALYNAFLSACSIQ